MGTKWVQIAPISMIFGQDCVVFHEDSESGLQMGPKGRKAANNSKKLHNPIQKSSKSELSGPISCQFVARVTFCYQHAFLLYQEGLYDGVLG